MGLSKCIVAVLGSFLRLAYTAVRSHTCVFDIDKALLAGDFRALMEITNAVTFESVLSNDVQLSYKLCTASVSADSMLRRPHLESQLVIAHAQLITQLEKEIDDFPDHDCCSCERLHQRKSVTRVDDLGSEVWPTSKSLYWKEALMLLNTCCTCATTVSALSR